VRIVANVKNSFLIATSKFILREFCGEVLGGECSPPPKKKKAGDSRVSLKRKF
jgi:hypothetical protein